MLYSVKGLFPVSIIYHRFYAFGGSHWFSLVSAFVDMESLDDRSGSGERSSQGFCLQYNALCGQQFDPALKVLFNLLIYANFLLKIKKSN